jgi:hypothetical protein
MAPEIRSHFVGADSTRKAIVFCYCFNFFQVDKNNYSNFIEVFVGIDFLQDL